MTSGFFLKKLERRESMNNRGQAALEYLMTYGWALIVIAIVVGVLIFIVSSPTAGVQCSSSDPAKILLKSTNILSGVAGTGPVDSIVINVQNATGGALSQFGVTAGSGDFYIATGVGEKVGTSSTSASFTADTNITSVVSGGNIYIFPKYDATDGIAAGGSVLASYTVGYSDQFSYFKTATITCQGKAA